jgi:RNA 2',3'-cyclic 3'-phosphodiesterase
MAGSVVGDERLRLFLGVRLPASAVEELAEWQARELAGAAQIARIVPRENLHITLAFLGSRPAGELPAILDVLRRASADTEPLRFDVTGYRETRSVGMLTLGDEVGAAARLAGRLHTELAGLGVYRPEARTWLPHVTVLRFRTRPRLSPPLPDLGRVVSSEMAVMISRLRPSGAQYEVLESVPLK